MKRLETVLKERESDLSRKTKLLQVNMFILKIIMWVTVFACLKTILTTAKENWMQNDIPSYPDTGSHSSEVTTINYLYIFWASAHA